MNKYLTKNGYCKWCTFKHFGDSDWEKRVTIHCKKMIDRALSRTRKGDKCHHCGHSKKEHDVERQTLNEDTKKYETYLDTCCGHIKRGAKHDVCDPDDWCECEVYL